MKVVALISGGKDSCFNMMHCVANGHQITALANLHPAPASGDEMDSWMYQTVGHDIVQLYEEAMSLPLYREFITGSNIETGLHYNKSSGDETEDLHRLLSRVLEAHPEIKAVSVGAIASNYQRLRVENVASRLGLTVLSYLWERNQTELLREMIEADVVAILIKVACIGLTQKHLGMTLAQIEPRMRMLHDRYGVHPCGEGGEYETIVLDCPLFKKQLVLHHTKIVPLEGDTAYLTLKGTVENKESQEQDWQSILSTARDLSDEYRNSLEILDCTVARTDASHQSLKVRPGHSLSVLSSAGFSNSLLKSCRYVMTDADQGFSRLSGSSNDGILHCCLILRDMADFAQINLEYTKLWTTSHPPSRVCVATSLPVGVKSVLYTIEVVKQEKFSVSEDERLWVQSRSYWAPSNIGPYSQITKSNGLAFISGQIGLIPATMQLADTLNKEIIWSLQSMNRIRESKKVTQWHGVLICYCLESSHYKNITTAISHHFDDSKLAWVIVTLKSGSQLPRSAKVEFQYFGYDPNGPFKVALETSTSGENPSGSFRISFDTTETASKTFWSVPAQEIFSENHTSCTELSVTFSKVGSATTTEERQA